MVKCEPGDLRPLWLSFTGDPSCRPVMDDPLRWCLGADSHVPGPTLTKPVWTNRSVDEQTRVTVRRQ